MIQTFAPTAFVVGTLLMASIPAVGLARDHGGRSFSGGSSSGARRYSGRQSFVSPRGYSGGPSYYGRGYVAPRSYGRPVYRGFYGGGVYPGYAAPYGYAYNPGYVYDPGYAYGPGYSYGPATPQACAGGAYDRYGAWVPNRNCYSNQQQYPPPQQNYDPNQQQYPPPQQNYDPNQQQYPPPQQNYNPNQQHYPQPQYYR